MNVFKSLHRESSITTIKSLLHKKISDFYTSKKISNVWITRSWRHTLTGKNDFYDLTHSWPYVVSLNFVLLMKAMIFDINKMYSLKVSTKISNSYFSYENKIQSFHILFVTVHSWIMIGKHKYIFYSMSWNWNKHFLHFLPFFF